MTFDTFEPFVKGKIVLPCLFFAAADWCPHCHSMAPVVARAQGALLKLGVRTYLVDADKNGEAVDALDVSGFPTLLFVDKDRRVTEYDGPRTASGIVGFARKLRQ